jgi:hypothetical protein
MSLEASKLVWQYSKARLGARLVLLAIADHADANKSAYPSVATLMRETTMSERAVHDAIQVLRKLGELSIRANEGPRGVNIYTINISITPAISAPPLQNPQGADSDTKGCRKRQGGVQKTTVTPAISAPKPSRTTKEPSKNLPASDAGKEFADWFRTLLPEGIRLSESWRESWAETFDKLVRLDSRTSEQIRGVCQWGRKDSFWSSNFMSPAKLRDKNKDGTCYFDVFAAKMQLNGKNGHSVSHTEQSKWGI